MTRFIQFFKDLMYSFPVQLVFLAFRRHQFMLFFWLLFTMVVAGQVGNEIGVPYLFLDPEYLEHVGYLSFMFVGMGVAALYVTWNLVNYMLNSHRYPFLASLQYPMGAFFINNSIIPLAFIIYYLYTIFHYQTLFEYQTFKEITADLLGFFAGFIIIILVTLSYFSLANPDAKTLANADPLYVKRKKMMRRIELNESMEPGAKDRVDFFITNSFRIRHTRQTDHYDDRLRKIILRRHHFNAFIAQIITLLFLFSLAFFMENPVFQIPTAASAFLFISVVISLFGMFIYWTSGWGSTAIIVFLFIANYLSKYDFFGYQPRVYGIDYAVKKAEYNIEAFKALSTSEKMEEDKKYFVRILNNWKAKNVKLSKGKKPKLVFLNVSGGGLRSGMFVTSVLEKADSIAGGQLMDRTFLITGASGGMLAAAYVREEFWKRQQAGEKLPQNQNLAANISKDLLNPMLISILSNDLFFPFHKFFVRGHSYYKDRGYMFEKTYAANTGIPFERSIAEYKNPEYLAQIPLIVFHTTIMNDSRRYFISPHPVSFLMRANSKNAADNLLEIDGVNFGAFFKAQQGDSLLLGSALRMNATFPFIFPNPVLPTEPATSVMDAGALDNFGVETTFRFLIAFKDWINENTSGVIVIQLRDNEKMEEPEPNNQQTVFKRTFDPLGTVYNNMENVQDFVMDQKLAYMDDELRGKLKFINFAYHSEEKDQKAAMSLHLSQRDKRSIYKSLNYSANLAAFRKLAKELDY